MDKPNFGLMVVNILEPITTSLASKVLTQVEANKDDKITVNIMSRGGDMMAGNAIIQALQLSPAKITTKVYGMAASMAAAISQVGDKRLIASDSIFQPHNGAALPITRPTSKALRDTAEQLDLMDGILIKSFNKSNLNEAALKELLTQDKPLTASKALKMGFFDGELEPIRAAAELTIIKMDNENGILAKLKAIKDKFIPTAEEHPEEVITEEDAPGEVVEVPAEAAPITRAEFEALVALVEELVAKMSPIDQPSVTEMVTASLDTYLEQMRSDTVIPAASNTVLPKKEQTEKPEIGILEARTKEIQSKFN